MNVKEHTSGNIATHRGSERPPCTGFTLNALSESQKPIWAGNSQTGMSTKNALPHTILKTVNNLKEDSHWYALRTTYGREKKVYDYLIGKNIEAFLPTLTLVKQVVGKRKAVTESCKSNNFLHMAWKTN